MNMEDFRKMAAKIEQHMQQLAAQDINDAPVIIDRIVVGVSKLLSLCLYHGRGI